MAAKSVAKGVSISMGPFVSARVDLFSLANSEETKETKTFLICPECDDVDAKGTRMEQFYVGTCGHVPAAQAKGWKTGECHKGMEGPDGEPVPVPKGELEAAKASDLEKNQMEVLVRPAAEVDSQTWATGVSYWAEPEKGTEKTLGAFAYLASDPAVALIGLMVMRGTERLFRLRPLNGGIVLQQVLRPNEMNQFSANLGQMSDKEKEMATTLAQGNLEAFDPEAFRSQTLDRLKAVLMERLTATGQRIASISQLPAAKKATDSLEDQLAAALAAAQAKKSA